MLLAQPRKTSEPVFCLNNGLSKKKNASVYVWSSLQYLSYYHYVINYSGESGVFIFVPDSF